MHKGVHTHMHTHAQVKVLSSRFLHQEMMSADSDKDGSISVAEFLSSDLGKGMGVSVPLCERVRVSELASE